MASPEQNIYDWLMEKQTEAAPTDEIASAEISPTVYSRLGNGVHIRIGNCESEFGPVAGGMVGEFKAKTHLQVLAFADETAAETAKTTARERVRTLSLEIANLLLNEPDLNGRQCNLKLLRSYRGWSKVQTRLYATAIMPIEINPW